MKAYQLLDSPEKWCKHTPARDADGKNVSVSDPTAVRWCALGALARCYEGRLLTEPYDKLFNHVVVRNYGSIGRFNDRNDYDTVVAVLKELDL